MMRLLDRLRSALFSLVRKRTLGAHVLPVNNDGSVVLVRHTYGSGQLGLAGGGVRRSETFREAAEREAQEELGLVLPADGELRLLGIYLQQRGRWRDDIAVFVVTGFTLPTEDRSGRSREIAAVECHDPSRLPSDVSPATRRRIAEWQQSLPASELW